MNIIYRVGDLLASDETVIVHGCNSHGAMGSGIALAIRNRYPRAYEDYRKIYDREGLAMGKTIWVWCDDRWVVNAITQKDFGRDPNTVYVSYDAIRSAVGEINETARVLKRCFNNLDDIHHRFHPFPTVGFPLIGAGLANGDWDTIAAIIEEESTEFQPVVYRLP